MSWIRVLVEVPGAAPMVVARYALDRESGVSGPEQYVMALEQAAAEERERLDTAVQFDGVTELLDDLPDWPEP